MVNLNPKTNCVFCTTKCNSFLELSAHELNSINQYRFRSSFKKGEVVFKENTPASNLVSISTGLVKTTLEGLGGRKLILEVLKGPCLIGGPGMYVDNKYHYTLTALSDIEVCFVDTEAFKKAVRANGEFTDKFISEFSARAITTYKKAISLTQKHMNGRLAEALVYFMLEIFSSTEFELPLSRQELADYTNMTKESACRILKKFKDDDIIDYKGNSIKILDKKRLMLANENG